MTANLTYNGQVVWSDIEQAHAAQAVVPQTVVATVAVPFTYGAPFDYEATVSVYGGGIGAGPNYQYSWARAILGVTLTAVPEPGSLLIVFAALFGMGLYKKAS